MSRKTRTVNIRPTELANIITNKEEQEKFNNSANTLKHMAETEINPIING